jgi:hypothetical protein
MMLQIGGVDEPAYHESHAHPEQHSPQKSFGNVVLTFIGGTVFERSFRRNRRVRQMRKVRHGEVLWLSESWFELMSSRFYYTLTDMTGQRLARLKIPDSPGVYTFRDIKKRPLYIGRATSLRDRVKSYFGADLIVTRGPRIVDMVTKARTVVWQETGSVLEAVLLESELIKRYQPFYNVDDRDDKSSQYVVITDEKWPRVFLARARDLEQQRKDGTLPYKTKLLFGPYPESGLIKEALKILRRLFPFKDKKSFDPRHDAFYRALGRSPEGGDAPARRRD